MQALSGHPVNCRSLRAPRQCSSGLPCVAPQAHEASTSAPSLTSRRQGRCRYSVITSAQEEEEAVQFTAQVEDQHGHAAPQAPQRVFMYNPNNPEAVEEMLISPHEDVEAAEELIAIAHKEMKAAEEAAGRARPGAPLPQRSPIPLRAVSPMPSRGAGGRKTLAAPLAGAPFMATRRDSRSDAMAGRGGQGLDEYSQRELLAQLDRDQGQIAHLQQYEMMYREWRMKAEKLDSDIATLQRLVAEKDAELAHGYKLLEASAAERSRLRHSYQAAQEKAKKLQLQLAEAEAKALPVSSAPPLLGAGPNGNGKGNGRGPKAGAPAQLGNVQVLIEELSAMAKNMASEMSDEVKSMSGTVAEEQQV